jgi:hypothetical protein
MLQYLVMNKVSSLGVYSKGQVLIQETEWVFTHIENLVVQNMIIIAEFIDNIVARMIFQVINNLTRCNWNELEVQHL